MERNQTKKKQFRNFFARYNTAQLIALSFAATILLGGIILWLPFCTVSGQATSFTDAIFTAATSVCVTGLVTVTTAAHWTLAGKIIILVLIQIGGLGLIALTNIIFIALKERVSIRDRRMIQESYNLSHMENVTGILKRVVLCVFSAEGIGAICYAFCFIPEYGLLKGIGYSVFTAISAFCNAGIDLIGENSLAPYICNPLINYTTIILIIFSGLGFTVWWDIWDKLKKLCTKKLSARRAVKMLSLHSKLVLVTSAILIFVGTFLIFCFEYNNPDTIGNLSCGNKVMASLFQSVTTRTAGFLTIDQGKLRGATTILCLFLMFVGGSPMGTAGGVKTTTIAVLFLTIFSSIIGSKDTECFHRKIKEEYIHSAIVVAGMSLFVVIVMDLALCAVMPGTDPIDVMYEITSAAATVGLTRGITSSLTVAGKWIVIFTMYLGRIGPLTLGTAVIVRARKRSEYRTLAGEDIMIG